MRASSSASAGCGTACAPAGAAGAGWSRRVSLGVVAGILVTTAAAGLLTRRAEPARPDAGETREVA